MPRSRELRQAPGSAISGTMLRLVMLLSLLGLAVPASAQSVTARPASAPPLSCEAAIAAAERGARTAPGLLHAIGLVESGRRDPGTGLRHPWPWTVTAEGVGTFYASKADAIAAVEALQGRGIASVDVGCMQVNLFYHPTAFSSLDEAFDPAPNAAYAARFLHSLFDRIGAWPEAAAAYHSFTPEPAAQYAKLIAAVWAGAAVPVVQTASGAEIVRFPGGGQMRLLRNAGVGGRFRVFGVLN